jgi:hypothetical protein
LVSGGAVLLGALGLLVQPGIEGQENATSIFVVPIIVIYLASHELALVGDLAKSYLPALAVAGLVAATIVLNHEPTGNGVFWEELEGLNAPTLVVVILGMILQRWINNALGIPNYPYGDHVALWAVPAALYWFLVVRCLGNSLPPMGWRTDTLRQLARTYAAIIFVWSLGLLVLVESDHGATFWSACSSALFFAVLRPGDSTTEGNAMDTRLPMPLPHRDP